jgi:hypothetical protein
MMYHDVFELFWKQVEESVQEGYFAKLTMAKTIGKLELKNIFLRPIYSKDEFKVVLKYRYRYREKEDAEEVLTLEEAFVVLKSHLTNPFSSVLLFTTTKDLMFKINKKGAGSIIENLPTFRNITQAELD